ncbi:MAG: FYVE zinc finger domain-containing protein, partial [Candidatus Heimdallarchaeota archaeon]
APPVLLSASGLDDRNNKSKTVKAALIKSLINQSDDDYWGHKLKLIFQNFGTLSVQIIENERLDTIRVLQDHSKNISLKTKNLQSEYNGLFCMGCKKSFDSNKIANCQVCKFIFCNSCSNTWERYNTEDLCLGSVMMS